MKLISIYRSIQSLIFLAAALVLSSPCFADYYDYQSEPDYTPYGSISIGRVLNQPDHISDSTNNKSIDLFHGDEYNFTAEIGLAVISPRKFTELHLGLRYLNLLNQGDSEKNINPFKFEVFGDYVFNMKYNTFILIGAGYKVLSDNKVVYLVDGYRFELPVSTHILDKFTARLSVGKRYGSYTLSIDHHSQWFEGKPFNDDWEYHVTSVNISKTF